ncbi:MAG: right-handed parallel beta-helix repeat-containing protein [Acidobacteria bacterium]|nr:right-handed parallel beta-helix repeat-containing protein [Acidobacteriota bacterium]
MKSMMLRLLVAVMLLLACGVVAFAQGGTITIQGQAGTFPTIQAAIDAVPQAGTVIVNGGDHQENLVITKAVQLIGQNGARINPATGNAIFVNNPSGSVQVIGMVFTIPANQIGILYDAVAATVQTGTILNCSFSGGLNSIFAREGNFRIVGNVFIGFSATAVVAQGIAGTTSRKVRVSSNSFAGNAVAGVTVQSFSSAITTTDAAVQVDDNLMINVKTGILVSKCSGNVSRNEFTNAQIGMDFTDSPGVLVEQNDFSTSASFATAFNAQGFTTAGMRLIRSNNAIVRNNTFAGGNGGIVVTQQSTGVTIDANFVRNMFTSPLGGGSGIVLTLSSSAEIHNNNIENNAFGLSVFGSTANATNNWWGAANGPSGAGGGNGNSISAGVPFAPFLTAPNPNAGAAQSG